MGERLSTRRKRENMVRICNGQDCTTVLSIYNKGTICYICLEKTPLVERPRLR